MRTVKHFYTRMTEAKYHYDPALRLEPSRYKDSPTAIKRGGREEGAHRLTQGKSGSGDCVRSGNSSCKRNIRRHDLRRRRLQLPDVILTIVGGQGPWPSDPRT